MNFFINMSFNPKDTPVLMMQRLALKIHQRMDLREEIEHNIRTDISKAGNSKICI